MSSFPFFFHFSYPSLSLSPPLSPPFSSAPFSLRLSLFVDPNTTCTHSDMDRSTWRTLAQASFLDVHVVAARVPDEVKCGGDCQILDSILRDSILPDSELNRCNFPCCLDGSYLKRVQHVTDEDQSLIDMEHTLLCFVRPSSV